MSLLPVIDDNQIAIRTHSENCGLSIMLQLNGRQLRRLIAGWANLRVNWSETRRAKFEQQLWEYGARSKGMLIHCRASSGIEGCNSQLHAFLEQARQKRAFRSDAAREVRCAE